MSTAPIPKQEIATISKPRLPYHPAIQERFNVDQSGWRALCDAVFPLATSSDSIVLALAYCRARNLDPFKKAVHIVPIWSKPAGRMVDTVWPGIGELRTTAFRTGQFAGRDEAAFGPDITQKFETEDNSRVEVVFSEWCQITVHRLIQGQRVAFVGPKVYWMETYATESRRSTAPNAMWRKRPRGQLEKCADGAALRSAFPEELGNEYSAEEMAGQVIESPHPEPVATGTPRPTKEQYQQPAQDAEIIEPVKPSGGAQGAEPEPFTVITIDGEALHYDDPIDFPSAYSIEMERSLKEGGPRGLAGFVETNAAVLAKFAAEFPDEGAVLRGARDNLSIEMPANLRRNAETARAPAG